MAINASGVDLAKRERLQAVMSDKMRDSAGLFGGFLDQEGGECRACDLPKVA
jgi:hypothetical protein